MKISKVLSFIVMLFLITTLFQCESQSALEPTAENTFLSDASLQKNVNSNTKVFYTKKAITVDGNENDWINAPKRHLRIFFDLPDPVDNKFDLSSYTRMLWDDDNLYVFVHVLDDSLSTNDPEVFNKDSFELFLDPDNSKNAPPDENIELPYPGTYDLNDEQIRFVWQEAPVRNPWLYDISPIDYAYLQTDSGWNLEIKIPFATMNGFTAEAGHVFGVEFHVNDNDGNGRENFLKWHSDNDFTFLYPSLFGTAVLFKNGK